MMDELRELYQEVILDHGKDPRNFRKVENANREATGYNPYAVTAWSSRCVLMKTVWFRMPPLPATVAQFRWRRHR